VISPQSATSCMGAEREAAYRRLAAAILRIDVESLAVDLRAARRAFERRGVVTTARLADVA
jgi:hypothetical protein